MASPAPSFSSFSELALPPAIQRALDDVGYETPTPIQSQAIPHLLKGRDLLGHAPTGTGKTAAFALPLLARLDMSRNAIQVMVLTPTRELAIQVAEALQRYAHHMEGFHVLPVYGGQEYGGQIRQLKRGMHVIVGTPGRVMDHMRKGTLKLDQLQALVLDEADEMLRMGFIDDVEWILEQAPAKRQMALFSATMPGEIQRIARQHLDNPAEITIETSTATAANIRQRYWLVSNMHKLDALTRILEVEPFDAILMFVRTKIATSELAERLEARGYAAAALNGDMPQKQREQMIRRLKQGSLDILVATDVAARGLDVDRISHVINYDIPYDIEAYIHRIGRTGRAGRIGDAILFVAPRERRMLASIERATRQKIDLLELPSSEVVNKKRIEDFKQTLSDKLSDALVSGEHDFLRNLLQAYQREHDVTAIDLAAALASMAVGDRPLLLKPDADKPPVSRQKKERHQPTGQEVRREKPARQNKKNRMKFPMERYRIEVGYENNVKPGNIVGAIANEAGLDSEYIGQIEINARHSFVDLPAEMPQEVFDDLAETRVCGQRLNLSLVSNATEAAGPGRQANQRNAPPKKNPGKTKKNRAGKHKSGKKPATSGRKHADTSASPSGQKRGPGQARRDKTQHGKARSEKPHKKN